MASPQPDKFVRVSTELFEATLRAKLSGRQFRVLYWVVRNTYGWNRNQTAFTWYRIAKELNMSHGGALTVGKELARANILWIRDKKIGIQKDYEKWDGRILNGDKASRPFRTRNPFRRRNDPKTEPKPFRARNETIPPAELNHSAEGMVFRRAKDSIKTGKDIVKDTIAAPAGAEVVHSPHPNGSKQKKPLTDVQKIVEGWKVLNNIPHEDKAWDKIHFPRCSKSAKSLLSLFGNLNDALGCMEFIYEDLTKKDLTCTIETVVKHSDRYRSLAAGRPR